MTTTTNSTVEPKLGATRGRGTRRNSTPEAPSSEDIQATPTSTKQPSKSAAVIKLLSRPKGATVAEMIAATDWQPHSVRAYLSGLRKKGSSLAREARKDGEQAYRLGTSAADAADQSKPAPRSQKAKGAAAVEPTSVELATEPLPSAVMRADATVA